MACVRVFLRVCVRACAHGGSVVRFRLTVTMLTPREHAACDRGCVPVRFCSHQQKV